MNKITAFALIIVVLASGRGALGGELAPDPRFARVVSSCKKSNSGHMVYFFKQWHLPPGVNTKNVASSQFPPQALNLESIHRQLDSWVQKKGIQTVIAEGCSGALDEKSSFQMNGWTIKDLKDEAGKTSFPSIPTSVPMKIEAKHGSQVNTLCGDRDDLVKEQLLAFSDARADLGYLGRITEHKDNPAKLKPYLDDVIEIFKLAAGATAPEAIRALKEDLKKTIDRIQGALEKRNLHLVERIEGLPPSNLAVVYGGLHADGLRKILESRGLNCRIIEPKGYQNDEALLLKQLDEAVLKI